jgi:localization factor PodJL
MKPGIPWSVKGIEPEVREAAKHAARRSGMTLGEWLNTVILDQADDNGTAPMPAAAPVAKEFAGASYAPLPHPRSETTVRLEDIAQQLSRLAQREQESAAIRPYKSPHARHQDNEMLNRILNRVESNERQAVEAFTAVNERLSVLGRQIAMAGQAKTFDKPEDVPGYPALESALRNIVDHIEISERRTRDSLKTMQDRLGDMAQRATDAGSDELVRTAPAFAGLETRLNELAARVHRNESAAADTSLSDSLQGELGALSRRIDEVQSHAEQMAAGAQSAAAEAAQRELRDIENRIQSLLRETQSTMAAQQVGGADVLRLRGEIATLTHRIEEVREGAATGKDMSALRVAVEQLSARMAQGPDMRPLADMDRRLVDLSQRLEQSQNSPRHLPQLGELERRIAELDHRLAEAVKLQGDGRAMVALEQQLGEVHDRIGRAEQQLGHLDTIERAITQLFDGLEQHRAQTAQSVEEAAQRAARMASPPLAGSPEIRALEEGLRAVRDSAGEADRRSQETLEAVHETLEQIVSKLAELETSAAGHQLATAMSHQAAPAAAAPAAAAPAAAVAQPFQAEAWQPAPAAPKPEPASSPTSFFDPVTAIPEPHFVPAAEPSPFVAEPVPQEPRLSAVPPPLRPQPDFAEAAPLADLAGDDFIAAARRAAQAAAGRGGSAVLPGRPAAKPGAGSRFSFTLPFLKGTRKPAAAAAPADPAQPPLVPILKAPGSSNDNNKRRTLILAGIVLLAAVSAFTFNMLARNARSAGEPVPTQSSTIQPDVTLPGSLGNPAPATVASAVRGSDAATTARNIPSASFDLPSDPVDITGSLPVPKTEATVASIVAEPGASASKVDMPPPEVGTESLREAAAHGDAKAEFIVASRYLDGDGIEEDVTRAAYWYQEAATRGLAPAQYRIATLFERGKGVPKDVATALVWYERAAAAGNVKSMHNAAVIAASTEAGTPDYDKAFRLFKDAAEHGLQDSQFNLAVLYERGLGTTVNTGEAVFWYLIAARNDDADAQKRAGELSRKLKPDEMTAIRGKADAWSPAPSVQDANIVAITEESWKGPGAAGAAQSAPQPEAAPASLNPIKAVQDLLMKLGFNVGESDGRMGARTANAIRLFQLQSGLKVTGEISPELIRVMQAKAETTGGA